MRISLVGNTLVGRMLPQFPETRAVASAKASRHDYTKKKAGNRKLGSAERERESQNRAQYLNTELQLLYLH